MQRICRTKFGQHFHTFIFNITLLYIHFFQDPECFHRSISNTLFAAQFFGLLPITNIRAKNINKFFFKRSTLKCLYSYIIYIGLIFMASVSVIHLLKTLNASTFNEKGIYIFFFFKFCQFFL